MAMVSVPAAGSFGVLRRQIRGRAAGVRHPAAAEHEQFPAPEFQLGEQ